MFEFDPIFEKDKKITPCKKCVEHFKVIVNACFQISSKYGYYEEELQDYGYIIKCEICRTESKPALNLEQAWDNWEELNK